MGKSKVVQMKKADKSQEARQILKNGIVNGMCVEKLIQLADINAFVGNVEVMVGLCGTSNYFNHMESGRNIHYLFKKQQNILDLVTRRLERLLMNTNTTILYCGMVQDHV